MDAATPKQHLLVPAAGLEALAVPVAPGVVSVVASREDSTAVVAEVASVVGLVVAAVASEEAMVLAETETASVHQAELHLALAVTVETVIAASAVDTTPEEIPEEIPEGIPEEEDDPMTTDPAVATVMAAVALAVTWNPSDAERVVGIATESLIVTVTVIATATVATVATGTGTEVAGTMTGPVMMITANEAMKAVATKILGNCDDTKENNVGYLVGMPWFGFSYITEVSCATLGQDKYLR